MFITKQTNVIFNKCGSIKIKVNVVGKVIVSMCKIMNELISGNGLLSDNFF